MALKEQDVVLTTKDASGNTVIQMPITRAANVEDLTSTCLPFNGTASKATADANGNNIATTYAKQSDLNSTNEILQGIYDAFVAFNTENGIE